MHLLGNHPRIFGCLYRLWYINFTVDCIIYILSSESVVVFNDRHKCCFLACWDIFFSWQTSFFTIGPRKRDKSCESTANFDVFSPLFANVAGEFKRLLLYWSWDKYLYTALYGFIAPPRPSPPHSCVLVIVGSHTDWNVCMYHNI